MYIYVRETKQRNETVSRKKSESRHRDVTKKKVWQHTKNDSAAEERGEEGVGKGEEK